MSWAEAAVWIALAAVVYGVVRPFLPQVQQTVTQKDWTKLYDMLSAQTNVLTLLTHQNTQLSGKVERLWSEVAQLRSEVSKQDKESALLKQRVDQSESSHIEQERSSH